MMFDLQTHSIPAADVELRKLAKRMGFLDTAHASALDQFRRAMTEATDSNRKILNHLLHGSFGMAFGSLRDTGGTEHRLDQAEVPLEVDLILDPDPDQKMIEDVLRPYGFQNVNVALSHLMDLAKEPTQYLSNRRCKHFLASVAPALLSELSKTPDPDESLVRLATVSDCLGAKGVLWELFSFNPPTLNLYVRLCASSDYLVGILKSNPGMIDELVDALQLGGLPSYQWLESNMEELAKGAVDLAPILHSFKNTQHMRVGIRDIIGRDDVRDTHRTLSDVAEICLKTAAKHQYEALIAKYGKLTNSESTQALDCPLVILGLGKLGGREPNYHSDLDVIFLYDPVDESGQSFDELLIDGTTSQFFFSELAASMTQFVTHSAGHGRLYEIDSRLRPTGKSGSLAVSMDEFKRYFESDLGHLWERQALCKARPIFGSPRNLRRAMSLVHNAITQLHWHPAKVEQIRSMRSAMQKDCTDRNLKRGEGGTVDVEFAVQLLQLKHAAADPTVLVPGTLAAIEKLVQGGFLDQDQAEKLSEGYQLLRSVEARLRLMNTTARHDLPDDPRQLAKLAYLLNYASGDQLSETVQIQRVEIRKVYDELL
jgi:glutamate-ammonia-ligase adenylyltransferase